MEPRLDPDEWYLWGAPSDEGMVVATLDGKDSPAIESFDMSAQPDRLQMTWRCYFDYGAVLSDPTGVIRSKGKV